VNGIDLFSFIDQRSSSIRPVANWNKTVVDPDRDQTDRVTAIPRALDSAAAADFGRATPHASPR